MTNNNLGLFEDYGWLIIFFCIICYMGLYYYLYQEYEENMTTKEFHKPFIKALAIVGLVTVFSMVSSRFLINYYMNLSLHPQKTTEYSSIKSQESTISTSDKVY